jgi:hypothetical protein
MGRQVRGATALEATRAGGSSPPVPANSRHQSVAAGLMPEHALQGKESPMHPPYDRAAVVTTALVQIFNSSLPTLERRRHAEAYLRDELAVIQREATALSSDW